MSISVHHEHINILLQTNTLLQALQFLLKLCSHPLLVIGGKMQDSLPRILPDLFATSSDINSELRKLHHSPKLVALQEILEECGIGVEGSTSEGSVSVGQHRVLIFAQHKVGYSFTIHQHLHQVGNV